MDIEPRRYNPPQKFSIFDVGYLNRLFTGEVSFKTTSMRRLIAMRDRYNCYSQIGFRFWQVLSTMNLLRNFSSAIV